MRVRIVIFLLTIFSFAFLSKESPKIKGINFTAPVHEQTSNPFDSVIGMHADWVSVIPYAYARAGEPEISTNMKWQWWGEKPEGVRKTIEQAKAKGLKVMLKPHVWVRGQGWVGDFECKNEEDWKKWEVSYEAYVMEQVVIAEELGVEMLCIGTEYRNAVQRRSAFWRDMIRRIRTKYSGKLTYAANWDNYENVNFWDQLDYIGVDAYFPLTNSATPSVEELEEAWKPHARKLKRLCDKYDLPLLLTEYGYCSTDHTAHRPWEETGAPTNMEGQAHAYEALYKSLWAQDWVAGGFLWKWFANHDEVGGAAHNRFTPQNKPVCDVIKSWYIK